MAEEGLGLVRVADIGQRLLQLVGDQAGLVNGCADAVSSCPPG